MNASISPDATSSLGYLPTNRRLLYASVASKPDFETNRMNFGQIFFTYNPERLKLLIKN